MISFFAFFTSRVQKTQSMNSGGRKFTRQVPESSVTTR